MKNLQFFENFKRNFAIFLKFFKILSEFTRKFKGKLRKFWENAIVGGSSAEPPGLAKLLKT